MGTSTVLIVDDEGGVTDAYRTYLQDEYDVRTAYSGEEALERLDETVDVVLLDRRMPNLSGDQVLEHIRAEGYNCQVAMVTAIDPDFDIVDMPFDDYVTKPVTQDELKQTVEDMLQKRTYSEKLQALYTTARKYATLQEEKSPEQIQGSEEFQHLQDRLHRLRREADDAVAELNEWEGF
ncbi:MAG: response regulator, partial [Halodesulfurarchaeum sp.]